MWNQDVVQRGDQSPHEKERGQGDQRGRVSILHGGRYWAGSDAMTTSAKAWMACLCLLACGASPPAGSADRVEPVVVTSPDGRLAVELITRAASSGAGPLEYRVTFSGHAVVDSSLLGVLLQDGTAIGRNAVLLGVESVEIDTSFEQFPGKRGQVTDRARETTLRLREIGRKPLEWQLIVRAYDDGVALRYQFPGQPGWTELALANEATEFNFPEDAAVTVLPLANFTTSHEGRYERRRVDDIPSGALLGLPMLVELPGVAWAAVLEADLTDYAGLYLGRGVESRGGLVSRLSPRPDDPALAVRAALPHASPWRLILVAAE